MVILVVFVCVCVWGGGGMGALFCLRITTIVMQHPIKMTKATTAITMMIVFVLDVEDALSSPVPIGNTISCVGKRVGVCVGARVGDAVGKRVGTCVGDDVTATRVGARVGDAVGKRVGTCSGGKPTRVGTCVGGDVGDDVIMGTSVG